MMESGDVIPKGKIIIMWIFDFTVEIRERVALLCVVGSIWAILILCWGWNSYWEFMNFSVCLLVCLMIPNDQRVGVFLKKNHQKLFEIAVWIFWGSLSAR